MYKLLIALIFFLTPVLKTEAHYGACRFAGDIGQFALPMIAFGSTLAIKDYQGTAQFVKGFLATEVTSLTLKYTVHEKRPRHGCHSFPSGHTAVAFSAASFIQRRYGWKFGAFAYAAAAYVGFSRIHCRAHWTHDVLAGAAIGILYSYIFTTPYKKTCFYPVVTENGMGIGADHDF